MAKLQHNKRWKTDFFTDDSGCKWKVHKREICEGSNCAIHNPSDHPLKDARIVLRSGSPFSSKPHGFVERFCPCGIGHSDPDSVAFYDNIGYTGTDIHGCCGHCVNGLYEKLNGDMNVAFDAEDWKPEDEGIGTDPLDFSRLDEREIDAEVAKFAIQLGSYPTCEEGN